MPSITKGFGYSPVYEREEFVGDDDRLVCVHPDAFDPNERRLQYLQIKEIPWPDLEERIMHKHRGNNPIGNETRRHGDWNLHPSRALMHFDARIMLPYVSFYNIDQ
jgi:hypothetical protein